MADDTRSKQTDASLETNDIALETEEDQQRRQFGPRGVPGKADPAKMTPQRKKKTPTNSNPPHTA